MRQQEAIFQNLKNTKKKLEPLLPSAGALAMAAAANIDDEQIDKGVNKDNSI